ncbi:Smr/MutS family protein [Kushneria phyllosphaerae]|uniref:Putative DNA endonuclease SmrA n=1 Tax=Kushneria phyllosphaerae TaxID=2100822 RepID=A0A2R8CK99_9GAMM|nr:Smr/MutS family protein [Kushneria phyllosphaerae]SPJ33309.1 putative DNA endonuclease SmrA [Kushneria phyllosphaerae]
MTGNRLPDDDDRTAFREAMRGSDIRPIHHDRADPGRPAPRSELRHRREAAASNGNAVTATSSRTSDGRVDPVRPSEALMFALSDLPHRTIAQLKRGAIAWQAGLDLHGHDLEQARGELEGFLHEARANRARCVLVVHGKAWSGAARYPVIKSHINAWLRELPEVLAFCSAQDRDGGTGAVYVLLRRTREDYATP